jgi:hypothetical protein
MDTPAGLAVLHLAEDAPPGPDVIYSAGKDALKKWWSWKREEWTNGTAGTRPEVAAPVKKRRRTKSPAIRAEVEKMLADYVAGQDLTTVTNTHGRDARTMRDYIPAVLASLSPEKRAEWTRVLESLGETVTAQ